jgi:predicted nuclease of predicted toxin-antitoxin system
VKFLIDNQLPPALARFIATEFRHEARHVTDLDLTNARDIELWHFASTHDFVLVSKDEDFTHLAVKSSTGRLIWVRTGNCRRAHLLETFRGLWPVIVERFEAGDRFIEVR